MKILCGLLALALPVALHAETSSRRLAPVPAPSHDPLFVDLDTIKRDANTVSFSYVLDIPVAGEWKSNAIDATIDCGRKTVLVRRLVPYSGPRGSGRPGATHTFLPPSLRAETISPRSTFAYLAQELCSVGARKG
jgi:hypothetical protein